MYNYYSEGNLFEMQYHKNCLSLAQFTLANWALLIYEDDKSVQEEDIYRTQVKNICWRC